jgi:prolyl oligopeptidase
MSLRRVPVLLAALSLSCATVGTAPSPALAEAPAHAPAAVTETTSPLARPGDTVEELHGQRVADPYRWMEELGSPELGAWVARQNLATDAWLQAVPGRAALQERLTALASNESVGPPFQRGGKYFFVYRDGKADQPVVMVSTSLEARGPVLIDPGPLSRGGTLSFAGLSVSDDGALVAYGMAEGGGDWQRWKVREVATGKDLAEELGFIKYYRPVFTHDGKGLYYSRFPAPPPGQELKESDHDCKVYLHRLGTPAEQDEVVYFDPTHPSYQYELASSSDGRWLVITVGDGEVGDRGVEEVLVLDLARKGARPAPLITGFDAEYVFAGSEGSRLFFQTSLQAPRKRVLAVDVRSPARSRWRTVVAEGPEPIDGVGLVGNQLLVQTLRDAHTAVRAYTTGGTLVREVQLPGIGSAWGFQGRAGDTETFYGFAGLTTPFTVYRYQLGTGKSTAWRAPRVSFDPQAFETRQVFFPSRDGTKVPMFITARKGLDLDGQRPTVMTAYGFGGISYPPAFDSQLVPWLERGGVAVLVNVRGGGEYGEAWHHAAWRHNRQTGLDDFIAAGEWLVGNHYTSPARLGAYGTSGGGMLVGAVVVQRPDLFGAVAPIAGVHDLLRFHLFGEGAGWAGDLGSPTLAEDFAFLKTISPLHNVRAGTHYPAMLLPTGEQDARVVPLHTYKFAAALQAAQAGAAPILVRVWTKTGHGQGGQRRQHIDQGAELYGFFARTLGLSLE